MKPEWRAYTAADRAAIFQITYDQYRRLGLRRSGCIQLDPVERRRLTKQRYNAKRQAQRAAERVSKSADRRAPLSSSDTVGTVRVPSSEAVVGLVESRGRDRESELFRGKIHQAEKIGARATSLDGNRLPQLQHPVRDRAAIDPTLAVASRPAIAAGVHSKNTAQSEYMRRSRAVLKR